jgi:type I site-specific restriction-modification system R (restriction) subunit
VPVTFRNAKGERVRDRLRVIDFDDPDNNRFLCVRELWVRGDLYRRRADIIGFVNGLPLLFVECKNISKDLKSPPSSRTTRTIARTVPHLFHHNAVVMVANGDQAKDRLHHQPLGALPRLEAPGRGRARRGGHGDAAEGVCDRRNFLDLVENFILFDDASGEPKKILGRNHQFLGVNRAVEAVREREATTASARRLLAHPGGGQELFDGDVHPQGAPQARRQLHLCGADRPRGPGQPDLQDLRRLRRGRPRPRPLPGRQRRASEPAAGPAQVARLLA